MNSYPSRPVVLCLSGHDPSGGAGLQADIEALLAQGCHAAPTVTALTVQDTVNVSDFRVLDRAWVMAQAQAVIADLPVAAVKLGMLGSVEMVDTVVELMQQLPGIPLVCDPVLRAGGGGSLGKDDVGYAMRERLLPIAAIATPNLPEARILAELPEGTADECAEKLSPFCRHLLITGGHGDETDIHNRLYVRGGDGADTSFRGRMYAPGDGIPEDPATGSATALLAAQLLVAEKLGEGTHKFRLEQGYEMGRPSDLWLEADVAGAKLVSVRVAGQAVQISSGVLEI